MYLLDCTGIWSVCSAKCHVWLDAPKDTCTTRPNERTTGAGITKKLDEFHSINDEVLGRWRMGNGVACTRVGFTAPG